MEGHRLPRAAWTFGDVEDRLVEAMITCWRTPDREAAWQRVKSNWPEALREIAVGDYDARGGDGTSSDVALRPASQTRREIAEMEEAFGWLAAVPVDDRRLVALAIAQLAAGKREVSWSKLKRRMGVVRGADGLRMRYGRAIALIASAQNGGNPRELVSTLSKCVA
ncbi:hypothetical protein K7957_05140 [Sphingomonas yunnanensis]|nr:hypothetical protein [Sphingomonas yunnanensis]